MRHSVELTLARLAFRQLTASKRSLWALGLAALPVLLAVLNRTAQARTGVSAVNNYVIGFQSLTVPVLLPIVALVVGTGIFGGEVDDGTITFVLGKPVPRWRIVLTRIVVAALATAAVLVPATLLSGVIALGGLDRDGLVLAFTAAVAVGGLLYCALFVALSLSTRRALVAGLGYVVIWEGLLSRTFGGSRALSVREYTLSFAEAMSHAREGVVGAQLDVGAALPAAVVVTVLATLYAIRRLRRFEIGEAV
jgi:ABC-2 type transport system permease protein